MLWSTCPACASRGPPNLLDGRGAVRAYARFVPDGTQVSKPIGREALKRSHREWRPESAPGKATGQGAARDNRVEKG